MVAIPDGFLVPFKTDGSISLVGLDGEGPYKLGNGSIIESSGRTWIWMAI